MPVCHFILGGFPCFTPLGVSPSPKALWGSTRYCLLAPLARDQNIPNAAAAPAVPLATTRGLMSPRLSDHRVPNASTHNPKLLVCIIVITHNQYCEINLNLLPVCVVWAHQILTVSYCALWRSEESDCSAATAALTHASPICIQVCFGHTFILSISFIPACKLSRGPGRVLRPSTNHT